MRSPSPNIAAVQARTVRALVAGQILGGLGAGATLSIGAILAAHVGGSDELSGAAATLTTLGAAGAAIPLARLAQARGRRISLAGGSATSIAGSLLVVASAGLGLFPLLLLGFALLGVGSAVNLQSRFAATDLAEPAHRGRQLSIVVWSTTIGSVVGPNLSDPGETIARALGMPHLTGAFAIAIVAQLAAVGVYLVALRPDPLLLSKSIAGAADAADAADAAAGRSVGTPPAPAPHAAGGSGAMASARARPRTMIVFAIGAIAAGHAVMVSIMAMTPVHMTHMGSTIGAVGFTISVHIAGMYALSPVFGWLSDRLGRVATILAGQALLAVGLSFVSFGEASPVSVTVGLTFIGLGWSATTVSGSALVADLAGPARAVHAHGCRGAATWR